MSAKMMQITDHVGRPRIVWVAYAGPNHSLLTWEGDSELLRSAYLADSPFSWAHIVILAIDAAGGVDTTWAPVDPYGPFETAFEQFPDVMAQEVVSGVQAGTWSVSPPDLRSVCTNRSSLRAEPWNRSPVSTTSTSMIRPLRRPRCVDGMHADRTIIDKPRHH